MDESTPTCNKRFASLGFRRLSRHDALIGDDCHNYWLGECISGAILYDETIRQKKSDGTPFVKVLIEAGIIPGIKVDAGAKELAGIPAKK